MGCSFIWIRFSLLDDFIFNYLINYLINCQLIVVIHFCKTSVQYFLFLLLFKPTFPHFFCIKFPYSFLQIIASTTTQLLNYSMLHTTTTNYIRLLMSSLMSEKTMLEVVFLVIIIIIQFVDWSANTTTTFQKKVRFFCCDCYLIQIHPFLPRSSLFLWSIYLSIYFFVHFQHVF